MKIECCIESIEGAIAAQQWNFDRIEICLDLNKDGLTPNSDLIKKCVEAFDGDTIIMIRPREGDFKYSKNELFQMKASINDAFHLKADGVVFGVLNENNQVNEPANRMLIKHAKMLGLETTFHRAFDQLKDPFIALDRITSLGFDRVLTSGLQPTAINGISVIKELVKKSDKKIEIMAGSGIDHTNALEIKKIGVDAIHFSIHKKTANNQQSDSIDQDKIMRIMQSLGKT